MSHPPNSHADAGVRIQQLRLSYQLDQALHLASQVLVANPRNWEVMGQAIHVLICLGEAESAAGLYQSYTDDPSLNNNLPPEVLVRLALQLGRRDLLEGMEPPESPSWLACLLTEGTDPVLDLAVEKVDLRVETGHPIFTFMGLCPHCSHDQKREFRLTLVSRHQWVCPSCFGLVSLGPEATIPVLQETFEDQIGSEMYTTDNRLIDQIKPRLTGVEDAPFIVRALGQEYHFLLNEFALKTAPKDGDDSEAGS